MPKGKGNVRTFYRHEYQKFLNGLVGRIFSENLSDAQIAAEVAKGFIPNKDDPYGTHGIEHKGVKLDDVPYEHTPPAAGCLGAKLAIPDWAKKAK